MAVPIDRGRDLSDTRRSVSQWQYHHTITIGCATGCHQRMIIRTECHQLIRHHVTGGIRDNRFYLILRGAIGNRIITGDGQCTVEECRRAAVGNKGDIHTLAVPIHCSDDMSDTRRSVSQRQSHHTVTIGCATGRHQRMIIRTECHQLIRYFITGGIRDNCFYLILRRAIGQCIITGDGQCPTEECCCAAVRRKGHIHISTITIDRRRDMSDTCGGIGQW
ncbi:Uncharacterised protein [Yersinia kristensenii]|nr:Uncharacterised protein [Yersinia kristensenii]